MGRYCFVFRGGVQGDAYDEVADVSGMTKLARSWRELKIGGASK